jgi:hypothetical protein
MAMATMSDAHSEWHRNAGVPMGQPGCPQDACDGDWPDEVWADDLGGSTSTDWLREGETVGDGNPWTPPTALTYQQTLDAEPPF